MFTCGVRDFKLLFPEIEIDVSSNFKDSVFLHNPYLTKLNKKDEGVEFYKVGYPIINNANAASTHFTQGFLFDMLAAADYHERLPMPIYKLMSMFSNGRIGDPDIKVEELKPYRDICKDFHRQRPDVHLTKDEKRTNIIRDMYGVEKYWVIAPGGKRDCTTKIWDWRRFQKVVDYFDGQIKFVVVGRSDHLVEKLRGVLDLTDKFNDNLRGIFPLVYHSEGVVSGVSFLMHLAAAFPATHEQFEAKGRKPCVAIYGGREPTTFTCYTNHQVLHTNGAWTCCDNGGCWQSRVVPIIKDPDKNNRMCHNTVVREGRTIQGCMDNITADDVIRSIEKYYQGNIYRYAIKTRTTKIEVLPTQDKVTGISLLGLKPKPLFYRLRPSKKEIIFLASMKSKGGGEQSAAHIVELMRAAGWKVHFVPYADVHENFKGIQLAPYDFSTLAANQKPDIPLFFYANDQIWDFCEKAQEIVAKASAVGIGINFANGSLPKCKWLHETGKLKAVVFQNEEKRDEFDRDVIGFENTNRVVLFGAINLDKFLDICPPNRNGSGSKDFVVLKHGLPDWRKYVTNQSQGTGDKIHIWQKKFFKETDAEFYSRLLKDIPDIRFEFMEAHPEVIDAFKDEPRMKFYKFNEIPVEEFLARGHVYLHRMSNAWRDQYPRVVAEALAAGLPVLSEPRDGTKDRIIHGNTGFYCCHYDEYLLNLKTLKRKEGLRSTMGQFAKDWARQNLDPRRWLDVLEQNLF